MPSAMTSVLVAQPRSNFGLDGRLRDIASCWAISTAATLSVAGPSLPLQRCQLLGRLARCNVVSCWAVLTTATSPSQSLGCLARCNVISCWAVLPAATLSVAGPSHLLRRYPVAWSYRLLQYDLVAWPYRLLQWYLFAWLMPAAVLLIHMADALCGVINCMAHSPLHNQHRMDDAISYWISLRSL